MNKNRKSTSGLMIIALLGLIIMAFILFSTGGDTQTMKYSEVIDYFEQGKVSEFVLNMKNGAMQLTLTEEATQELLEQQPGMTLGGQQTGALGGLWGGSSSGAASDTAKQAVLTYTLPYAGELLDKDNLQRYREIYAKKWRCGTEDGPAARHGNAGLADDAADAADLRSADGRLLLFHVQAVRRGRRDECRPGQGKGPGRAGP